MIPKGTMLNVKKILGAVIGIAGVGMIFGVGIINNLIADYQMVFGGVLIFLSYLLVVSGRQL